MPFDTAYPQILANLAAGNEPVSLIDSNFTPLYNGILSLNTFGNYYVDSGAANAYVVTITARQSATLAAGLPVQLKAANANTGASTLNVNGTGAKNILNPDGSALSAGQIRVNAIVSVMYDGIQYQLLTAAQGGVFKTLVFTRNTATATGTQAITGAGFKPKYAKFTSAISGGAAASWGGDDGVLAANIYMSVGAANYTVSATGSSVVNDQGGGNVYTGLVQSFDSDGLTMSWTRTGVPGGTLSVIADLYR